MAEAPGGAEQPAQKKARLEDAPAASDAVTQMTLYVRCKHIVKPWELLNVFLRDHRDALGLGDLYGPAQASDGSEAPAASSAVVLKPAADIRCVYVPYSRKPFFLLELPTGEATAALLRMSQGGPLVFKGETVTVMPAMAGATVADERRKQEARAGGPVKVQRPVEAAVTTTTFVPRILKR
jgi:hypothetical protein